MNINHFKHYILRIIFRKNFLFFTGCFLGICFFLIVFGVKILDVTYVDWLIGKGDLSQHYFGWAFYRTANWMFPFGCCDALTYPQTTSIVYTDSIPAFAILFKTLRNLLPNTFQYFGWFGMIAYALQGGIAALLIQKLLSTTPTITSTIYSLIGTCFFLIAAPFYFRIFFHTALTAHFIVLFCLYLQLRHPDITRPWKDIIIWSLMMVCAVAIHAYFVPIVGICLLSYIIKLIFQYKCSKSYITLTLCTPILIGILIMIPLGGFNSSSTNVKDIASGAILLGRSSANLNTFWNTRGFVQPSIIPHPGLDVHGWLQTEGFAYLGLGVIVGVILLLGLIIYRRNTIRKWWYNKGNHNKKQPIIVYAILACIFFLLSLSHVITIGDHSITLPIPNFILKPWSIFRSTGRFIWVTYYIILLFLIVGLWKIFPNKKSSFLILVVLFIIQCIDLLPWQLHNGKEKIANIHYPESQRQELQKLLKDKQLVCFSNIYTIDPYGPLLQEANIAGCKLNAFYLARFSESYYSDIQQQADSSMHNPNSKYLYVMVEGLPDSTSDLYNFLDFNTIGNYTLASAKEVRITQQNE